ncbi:tRNA processing endoribonuclease [Ephemerocybe angulata]|uniref:ribonuclease Z n=1 Tax=Ephemerocybe angulata TaxID=980116 RepID=A0A8H6IDG1_9AGAR|nr:tRNA processing endoribonuclease [Tulosesus angulatus]
MQWTASVLSTVSADSEPALMISFDEAKYMFNAGENNVRALCHSQTNRKKVKAIFCTQLTTERAGGISGTLMTLADANKLNDLSLVGPRGLAHRLASARFFTYRQNINVIPVEVPPPSTEAPSSDHTPTPVFKDQLVSAYAYSILPTPGNETSSENDTTLKRKRESSPDGPRKKSASNVASDPLRSTLLTSKLQDLSAEQAESWRRFIINNMFPGALGSKAKKPKAPPAEGVEGEPVHDDYRPRHSLPKAWYSQLPRPERSALNQALAYVVVGPSIRGKFDAAKAVALGVPRGPLRGVLSRGQSITFTVDDKVTGEDGEIKVVPRTVTVQPEECVGPSSPRSTVIVLDVPSKQYIPNLLKALQNDNDSVLSKLRSKNPEDKKEMLVQSIFHMVDKGVLDDPRYVEFMHDFGDNVQHIIGSREYCPNPVTFTSAAANQLRLNKLDDAMFPLPQYRMEPHRKLSDIPNLPKHTYIMETNTVVPIHPAGKPAKSRQALEKDYFHPVLKRQKSDGSIPVDLSKESAQKFEEARQMVEEVKKSMEGVEKKPGDDVVVVPLGTGSAIPGQYRTVSSTLLQIPEWGNVLLDAGEGTYFQLARQFGEDGVDDVLRNMKCLFVSHAHADHLMGVAMLLRKRQQLDPPPQHPLYFVSNSNIHIAMRDHQLLEDLGIQETSHSDPMPDTGNGVIPILSEALHWKRPGVLAENGLWAVYDEHKDAWLDVDRSIKNAAALRQALGLSKIATVDMLHGTKCYGLVLWHRDGWSVAFSGDTEPSDTLVRAAKGVTLLIHEATMADDQADMARAKRHSTFGEAMDIGRRMCADKILLTHFSARHPKVPMKLLQPESLGSPRPEGAALPRKLPVVGLAFDQCSLRLGDMWKMQYYLPALEQNHMDMVAVDGEGDDEYIEKLRMSG